MPNNLTDNEITIKALKELLEVMLSEGDLQRTSTVSHTIDLIDKLEAKYKELQELVNDMGGYFPACIECEGKTPLGERTDKCVYMLDNTNYCTKRGISNIVAIQKENRSLKAENERLSRITRNLVGEIKAEAYQECIEKLKEKTKGLIGQNFLDDFLKGMVGE